MEQPIIERRSFPPGEAEIEDLPFVASVGRGRKRRVSSYWSVPHTDDYGYANAVGCQYAADFMQFLKQNPLFIGFGLLSHIINDMSRYKQGSAMSGYEVGFFGFLEKVLYVAATSTDHYAIADGDAKMYAEINA